MSFSHALFKKRIWHFSWPSRGRTRQLKADTVALAKTWQGAPHTAAEMFSGENPAPNTCTSLPPRQPLKTKWWVHYHRGKSFFTQNSNPCFPAPLHSFYALLSPNTGLRFPVFCFFSLSSGLQSLEPLFCQIPIIQQPIKCVKIPM